MLVEVGLNLGKGLLHLASTIIGYSSTYHYYSIQRIGGHALRDLMEVSGHVDSSDNKPMMDLVAAKLRDKRARSR